MAAAGAIAVVISLLSLSTWAIAASNESVPTAPIAHASTAHVRGWLVPRNETTAPTVPTSGGATIGSGGFNAVACTSANNCVAVGADGNLNGVASTTSDGGSTWSQSSLVANMPELNAVSCSSTSNCVAVGNGATASSSDGGVSWSPSSIPTPDTSLLGVACPSASRCVAVGVSPDIDGPLLGQVVISSDGGTSWSVPSLPDNVGALGSVSCPSLSMCVAVGASILVSTNGGQSWNTQTLNGGTGVLRSISCASTTTCVAIGGNPAVAQNVSATAFAVATNDGGVTWQSLEMPAGSATMDVIACAGGTSCTAAGAGLSGGSAPVLTTTDGGASWTSPPSLAANIGAISAISCVSATDCVYVGKSGTAPITVTIGSGSPADPTPVAAQVRKQKVAQ